MNNRGGAVESSVVCGYSENYKPYKTITYLISFLSLQNFLEIVTTLKDCGNIKQGQVHSYMIFFISVMISPCFFKKSSIIKC